MHLEIEMREFLQANIPNANPFSELQNRPGGEENKSAGANPQRSISNDMTIQGNMIRKIYRNLQPDDKEILASKRRES